MTSLGVVLQSNLLLKASNDIEISKHISSSSSHARSSNNTTREIDNRMNTNTSTSTTDNDDNTTDRVTRIGNDNDGKQKSIRSIIGSYIPSSIKSKFKTNASSATISTSATNDMYNTYGNHRDTDTNIIVGNPIYNQKTLELISSSSPSIPSTTSISSIPSTTISPMQSSEI